MDEGGFGLNVAADADKAAPRGKGAPVWHLIRVELEHEIRAGLIAPGARLPSEAELSRRFAVNRHTVRTAYAKLAEQGLVVARHGAGVFVVDRSPEYPITRSSKWSELEDRLAVNERAQLIAHSRRPASPHVAEMLGIAPGSDLIMLETLRRAGPRAASYGYHAFEAERFPGIEAIFAETLQFNAAFRHFGIDAFFRASTWIDCRMPRLVEADALQCDIDQPVMIMSYVDVDAERRPIFYGLSVLPSGSLTLRVDT